MDWLKTNIVAAVIVGLLLALMAFHFTSLSAVNEELREIRGSLHELDVKVARIDEHTNGVYDRLTIPAN